ncbi:MAG: hypothetical protein C0501_09025 [Isosphaera sp.]|nr:hypothetical protein [Isosphaera sp.]
MKPDDDPPLVTFEARFELDPPGTPPAPRPPRPSFEGNPDTEMRDGALVDFDDPSAPPGTPPAPPDRPRAPDPDAAFARELADRVSEYVRTRPTGLTAEQLAALVQQFLARRPA